MNLAAAKLLSSMPFAVYSYEKGRLEAVFAEADHAAAFAAILGDGALVVFSGPDGINPSWRLWIEGADGEAGESYDAAAAVMLNRLAAFQAAAAARTGVRS